VESSCEHCHERLHFLVFYDRLCIVISLNLLPVIFPDPSTLRTEQYLTVNLNENFRSVLVYSGFVIQLTMTNCLKPKSFR
jgi:hypothetical protein